MSDDLEDLGRAIADAGAPPLDPERRSRMRSRVLSAPIPEPSVGGWRLAGSRIAWRRIALAAAVLALFSIGLGGAASASLPGDPGFALKIQAEHVQLLLTPDLYRRLDRTLEQADRRLDELELLARRDTNRLPLAADAYDRTLTDVRDAIDAMATSEHADRSRALDEARVKLDHHLATLAEIQRVADGDVERAVEKARETDERVREVESEEGRDDPTPQATPSASLRTTRPGTESSEPTATIRPARTSEPSQTPAVTATPVRSPTVSPSAEPTRTVAPTRTPDETRTPSPSPTKS